MEGDENSLKERFTEAAKAVYQKFFSKDKGNFKESEHPRAKSGKHAGEFTKKGSGGSSSAKEVKTEKKEPKEAKRPKKGTIKEEAPIVENKELEKQYYYDYYKRKQNCRR